MADMEKVKCTLKTYMERGTTDDTLKLTPFMKCVEACGLKQYKTNIEASVWPKNCDKAKKCPINKVATSVIDGLAADVCMKKNKQKTPPPADDPEVKKLADEIRCKIAEKAGQAAVKGPAVDKTTARLTDASGYTGSHKERFNADGTGKGIEGRSDRADNSGYVGNYKGAGTFDKK
jgi:hypothetical protein